MGTMLGSEVTRLHGGDGLPDGTIDITFKGRRSIFRRLRSRGRDSRLEGDE